MEKRKARRVAVIGAGPAGLMAAETAAKAGADVTIYDRMRMAGRKFLLAGRGGLNLTHSEPLERFVTRYGAASERLRPIIERFTPDDLRAWCHELGEETFIGTSGRVFPKSFRASPLLRAWLARLEGLGISFAMNHRWIGFDVEGHLKFDTPGGPKTIEADAIILALGGASWPRLGSDGAFAGILEKEGVAIRPLAPANCGVTVDWSRHFVEKFAGEPLKACAFQVGARTSRSEAVVTRQGLEGGAIYALLEDLRAAIDAGGERALSISLKPDLDRSIIIERLAMRPMRQSLSAHLRKALNLSPVAIGLLREAEIKNGLPLSTMPAPDLADLIAAVPVAITGLTPLDHAISTYGGVALDEIDDSLMLRRRPGLFVAGEMIDWSAPTGGYLLQACFATGAWAGARAAAWAEAGLRSAEPSRS